MPAIKNVEFAASIGNFQYLIVQYNAFMHFNSLK